MLEFDLIFFAKFDMCSCKTTSKSTGSGRSGTSFDSSSRARAVIVRSICLVVAGSDNLANKVCHVHLDVEFAEINKRVKLYVDEAVW